MGGTLAVALLAAMRASAAQASGPCTATCTGTKGTAGYSCSFSVIYDPFASSTGYLTFEECGGAASPTIRMDTGVVYEFKQSSETNWYHPMGFAYFADGAIRGMDELEPGIALGTDKACAANNTCQAPQYFKDGQYLGGTYDNLISPPTGGDDFGLDVYEPLFARGRDDWIEEGKFSVKLKLTDTSYTKDLFYFCHIHGGMSGRIKVHDAAGEAVNKEGDTPDLPYSLETPDVFDRSCGGYGVSAYNTSNAVCPDSDYVCASTSYTPPAVEHFGVCLEAMDCKMHVEMQTASDSTSPATTFMRQMIPHHENAINMAKLLLKQDNDYGLECGDAEEDIDCDMTTALWEMINGQNAQITLMRNWLTEKAKPRYATCAGNATTAATPAAVITTANVATTAAGNATLVGNTTAAAAATTAAGSTAGPDSGAVHTAHDGAGVAAAALAVVAAACSA